MTVPRSDALSRAIEELARQLAREVLEELRPIIEGAPEHGGRRDGQERPVLDCNGCPAGTHPPAARAVPVDAALIAGIRSVDAAEAGRLLGRDKPALAGLAIPYPSVVPPYFCVCPDSGPVRCLFPAKREIPIYVPPAIVASPEVGGDLDDALIIVDSPIKALALAAIGLHAVGLGGIATTLDRKHRLNPSWDRVELKERVVVVLFDSNRRTSRGVAEAEARLVAALAQEGARVRMADLPRAGRGKPQGPDDYLASCGADALFPILVNSDVGDPFAVVALGLVAAGPDASKGNEP